MRLAVLVAAVLTLNACATALPVSSALNIDPETGPSCTRACKAVGMKVAGIVFIRNMGGCVCEPGTGADSGGGAPRAEVGRGGASAAQMGGAVLVALEEEEAQRQQSSSSGASSASGAGGAARR